MPNDMLINGASQAGCHEKLLLIKTNKKIFDLHKIQKGKAFEEMTKQSLA